MNSDFIDFQFYDIPAVADSGVQDPKSIIIVLRKSDHSQHEALLLKILSAIKLDVPTQVSFIPLEDQQAYNTGVLPKTVKQVIAFGLKPSDLGFNSAFKGYRFYQTETFSILFSHTLAKLSAEQAKKKQLWAALKSEFMSDE